MRMGGDNIPQYTHTIGGLVANVLDVSWTCPGLVHLSLFLAPTAIPQGHWVTWLLWVPCPVEVPQSESWAIWLHQKWKLLHQMQIFCAAVSLYHSWMHRGSSTSLHWYLFYPFLYVLMLFVPSICTVYPLSCHMVSMSWNDHSLLMQCPGRVQAMSWTCPASCPFGAFLDVLLKDIAN